MTRALNAFEAVRPRAASAAPGRQPLPRGRGSDIHLRGSASTPPRVLSINGRPMATLAPRPHTAFAIESGAAAQASIDKRRALVKGGI